MISACAGGPSEATVPCGIYRNRTPSSFKRLTSRKDMVRIGFPDPRKNITLQELTPGLRLTWRREYIIPMPGYFVIQGSFWPYGCEKNPDAICTHGYHFIQLPYLKPTCYPIAIKDHRERVPALKQNTTDGTCLPFRVSRFTIIVNTRITAIYAEKDTTPSALTNCHGLAFISACILVR